MNWLKSRSVTFVAGNSSSGKSTFCLRYLANTRCFLRFIYDFRGEYAERLKMRAAELPGDLASQIPTGWILFDPWRMFPSDPERGLSFFAEWAWEVCLRLGGRKIFFCDEVTQYCSPYNIAPELATLASNGRKGGVESLFISNEPHRLNSRIRGQLTELVAFSLLDPLALDFCRGMGLDPERVRALSSWQFIAKNLLSHRVLEGRIPDLAQARPSCQLPAPAVAD